MQNRERVIDVRALLRCVLEKWRLILLAGLVICAVLAGKEGYAQYKLYQEGQQASTEQAPVVNEAGTKAAELKRINDVIENKNTYFVNSILGKIDPAKEGRATADLVVMTGADMTAEAAVQTPEAPAEGTEAAQETQTETAAGQETAAEAVQETQAAQPAENETDRRMRTTSLVNYYISCVNYRIDYTAVAKELGVDAVLIPELVSVTDSIKDDNMASITVIYPTEEGAVKIRDAILVQVSALTVQAQEQYGRHTLQIVNEASAVVQDSSLYKWAYTRTSEITSLINNRKTLEKNLSSGVTAPSVAKISKRDAAMAAARQGVIGLAAGIIGAMIVIAFYLIAAGKVLSGRELNRHYGLRRIACVPGRKYGTLKGLDKLAVSVDAGYYNHPKRSVCLQVADAGIRSLMRRDAQIALVSDLPTEYVEKLAAEMNKLGQGSGASRYFAVPCVQQTPDSIEALDNCDAAVLVAKAESSTYKGTGDVLDAAGLLGREVIGSIVLM